MHGPSLPSNGFLGRLKSHKVIQWTLAYAALAYTVLHGVEMVAGALSWPHVIARVLTLVLILGIPVIATLAWYHGAKGLKKISGPELAILTVLLFIAGTLLWAFSGTGAEHQTAQTEQRAPATENSTVTPTAAEPAPSTPVAPRTAVAVLPFANLTGDASKEYLGDGMAEAMINTLTKVPGLKVPARTSTFAYKGRATDIRQIARDLGVGTILEGSVQAAGKRLRITAQLINAHDGLHLWSETYDEEFTDIFKLQDKLAKAIALALEPKLAEAGASPVTAALPTQDVEAYNLYLQGWSLVGRVSLENEQRAITYFKQALARDPNFAQAYAGIAEAYAATLSLEGRPSLETIAASEQAARQALALDASLAYPHLALGGSAAGRGQFLEMAAHTQAALSLAPNDGYVQIVRAAGLAGMGRLKDGLDAGQRAYALAPANPIVVSFYAWLNAIAGRDTEASRYAAAAIDVGYPKDNPLIAEIGELAAWRSGNYSEAIALNAKVFHDNRIAESARLAYGVLEHPAQRAPALAAIAGLFSAVPATPVTATDYASTCLIGTQFMAIAGGLDEAFALTNKCLTRAGAGTFINMPYASAFLWTPELRSFRRDARFGSLVNRLGLMEYYQQYGPPDDCELKNNKLTCH
jgi:TolB-like protein/Flp pilus assembly protein TadD